MTQTSTISRQHEKQLQHLKHEVSVLRSFVISMIGEDKEGRYRPKFVKEILKASQENPEHTFRDPQSFMDQLKRS